MRLGLFTMPSHPPERRPKDAQAWDLAVLRHADALGFDEAWIGEHFTSPWEPNPTPDILIAQALLQTQRIKLCPGAHLLPFHHPAELAARVAFMDHIAEGRYMFGVGASGLPSDWAMFCVDGMSGQTREMTREALDIIIKLWTEEPGFEYHGKYWHVRIPEKMFGFLEHHIRPYQKPYPPIGIAGLSPGSDTLKLAGERGFSPLSLNLSPSYLASHWAAVEEGARRTGKVPDRRQWRIVREIFVADTDEEAWEHCVNGAMGRMMREYFMPLLTAFDVTKYYKEDPNVPDEAITLEYLVRNNFLVGSPDTVERRLREQYEKAGGFGTLLLFCFDYADDPEPWMKSMRLLAEVVMPRVADLEPEAPRAALSAS